MNNIINLRLNCDIEHQLRLRLLRVLMWLEINGEHDFISKLLATYVFHPIGLDKTSQDQNYEVEMKEIQDSRIDRNSAVVGKRDTR